ncbi:MAG TPA: beta-ketoacyl synthase N-terminal-like domain-containing protein [Micromonosporaceae bacterium]
MTAVVITGTGLVCPIAASVPELLAGSSEAGPPERNWFDPVPYLGKRGWKYFSPATRYVLAAAGLALADAELDPAAQRDESMGVVVGTNFAAAPVVGRFDDVVIAEGADMLSPAEAANFSVNIPASQISMKYAMRAFNLTLTDPVVAGLESLLTLSAAMRRGRARLGIAGATEERPPTPQPTAALNEGACCFTLELAFDAAARGARVRATLAGGFSRFLPPGADPAVLAGPLTALLEDAVGPLPYAGPGADDLVARQVDGFVTSKAGVELVRCEYPGADGRYATASPLLQLAGLVAEHGQGLVVATSPQGHVAALRVRDGGDGT